MAHIKGKDLKVICSEFTVACARSCEIDISNDTIETASPTSGQYKSFIKGRTSWSVSVSGLVAADDEFDLLNLIDASSLTLNISNGVQTLEGDCICTQVKYTGTIGNLAQYSATFQGSGILG